VCEARDASVLPCCAWGGIVGVVSGAWRVEGPLDPQVATHHPDAVIARLASRQNGVVARWQLLRLGLSAEMIKRRVASGHLHPVHRGVYAVGHPRLTGAGRRMAAALAVGWGAAVSHRSAAGLHGVMIDQRALTEVTTPGGGRSRRLIVVHRSPLRAEDVARVDGIPVTTVARTILDLAPKVDAQRLASMLERAERLRVLDVRPLHEALERRANLPGGPALRDALDLYDPRHERLRSHLERIALPWIDRHRLPRPELNARVEGLDVEVDLLWRAQRVVLELDGWETHRTRAAFERDRARDQTLAAHGHHVLRATSRQLERDDARVAATVHAVLRERATLARHA
jgi:very-short-patch-repair endonuclease